MEESEASREVFTSLLGFYMGRATSCAHNKLAVLDGLKQWCVQAARMEKAPHLSDSFLQKMGMSCETCEAARRRVARGSRWQWRWIPC